MKVFHTSLMQFLRHIDIFNGSMAKIMQLNDYKSPSLTRKGYLCFIYILIKSMNITNNYVLFARDVVHFLLL